MSFFYSAGWVARNATYSVRDMCVPVRAYVWIRLWLV